MRYCQNIRRFLPLTSILNQQPSPDALSQIFYNLNIHPFYRLEFTRPVFLVMRPGQPDRFLLFPFGGHPQCHLPNLSVIPPYASMRRSRRNGHQRRVCSWIAGSQTAVIISSLSEEALASIRPNGSAINELPKHSRPPCCAPREGGGGGRGEAGDASNPTRLQAATYTPFAMA